MCDVQSHRCSHSRAAAQLEVLVSGNAEIDLNLLRTQKTVYRGFLSGNDRHIKYFWDALESFTTEDKRRFLQVCVHSQCLVDLNQFVWGRNRLPASAVGFGRDTFKISDHPQSMLVRAGFPAPRV